MKPWSDYSLSEAQAELERVIALQPEWCERFVRACRTASGNDLDFSLESLRSAWVFVLADGGVVDHPNEPDPWMQGIDIGQFGLAKAWMVTYFSAYWTTTLAGLADTRWKIGEEDWAGENEPIFVVGGYESGNRPRYFARLLQQGRSAENLLELTKFEIEAASSSDDEDEVGEFEVIVGESCVELSYNADFPNEPKFASFYDKLIASLNSTFGEDAVYCEEYGGGIVVDATAAKIEETVSAVTRIAEAAGNPFES